MASRADLQTKLEEVLGSDNVYFQPPPSVKMQYPAIVFERAGIDNTFANDAVYSQAFPYTVTVIDRYPDSEIVKRISRLPMCRWNRHFKSDNLNHDVFTLYY